MQCLCLFKSVQYTAVAEPNIIEERKIKEWTNFSAATPSSSKSYESAFKVEVVNGLTSSGANATRTRKLF